MKITHIDLFSGIGGASIAVDEVFGKNNVTHIFCDNEPFAQAILKKHWPEAPIIGDIRAFTTNADIKRRVHGESKKQSAKTHNETLSEFIASVGSPFILTGGFPCQPFSQAGRRKGTDDDRYLWPEMLRVIREFKPQWVIGENVAGLLTWDEGVVLEQVCLDLEGEGYEVQPFVIPAVAVNAPHRRDRVWIVAHRESGRERFGKQKGNCNGESKTQIRNDNRDASNASSKTHGRCCYCPGCDKGWDECTCDASHARQPHGTRSSERVEANKTERSARIVSSERGSSWDENWLEVATWLCGVFNGLSEGLDKDMSDGVLLKYAPTLNAITRQDLPYLWKGFQSKAFQWRIGRFDTVQDPDYVFAVLWKLKNRADKQICLPFESEEVQNAYMRNVWDDEKSRRASRGPEYQEQYAREHQDTLSSMSHEVALAAAEIQKSFLKDRNARLKGLGNAWVPRVAEEIFAAIKHIDRT
jgi:DNA-cytosine methyltransferase